jgi:hypothetical protein
MTAFVQPLRAGSSLHTAVTAKATFRQHRGPNKGT